MAIKSYHSDKPITCEQEDLFNMSDFADKIISILSDLDKEEHFVIGIFAKWGFGKTSTIKLIENKLSEYKETLCPICKNARTLEGNTDKILREILSQIYKIFPDKKMTSTFESVHKYLEDKVEKLPSTAEINTQVTSLPLKDTLKMLLSIDVLNKIKKEINTTIQNSNKKIVVFIDDIDRLDKEQIIEVFRMINNIADYGGMTYILPFDKDFVCAAIEESLPDGQSGVDYIEKIIQLPLNLPLIRRSTTDEVFIGKLIKLFENYKIEIGSEEWKRFQSLYYYYGINKYVVSPRDINKIINVLRFTLPSNYGEVNIVDLIAIEIIRVFDEQFYYKIINNKNSLVSRRSYFKDSEELKNKLKEEGFSSFETIISGQLFPFNIRIDALKKLQRIASEYYFDIFFASLDEQDGVSDRKIVKLLTNAKDKTAIDKGLQAIANYRNYSVLLEIIADEKELIYNKLDFCKSLLDMAEIFSKDKVFLKLSALQATLCAIDKILKDSSNKLSDYIELLKYNYSEHRIHTIPYLIERIVERNESRYVLEKDEDLEQYKKASLAIIRDIAKNNEMPLSATEQEYHLYLFWLDFGTKEETSKYLKKHIKSSCVAMDFISQFIGGRNIGNSRYREDLTKEIYCLINEIIDVKYLYNIIIKDKKYNKFKNIKQEDVPSLHRFSLPTEEMLKISKVGNEHTDDFREIVAKRFIYLYENTPLEEKTTK